MNIERNFIINDYINFCKDTKKDPNKKENRKKYINAFLKNNVLYYGLNNYEQIKKDILFILNRNTLTIKYLSEQKAI